ncbi:efflux RND transporter periplasmic adaptor subunit [Paenibacillus macerans]|uniref:efflux RND transporter periplasmic adaptor subunit n=1 Tax=Paenibacillus macerans TaxID=44252 RepID=UPI003D320057
MKDSTLALNDWEGAQKKGIRRAIWTFVLVMGALTFFSNSLLNLSLAEVTVQRAQQGTLSHEVTGSGIVEAVEIADIYVETNWSVSEVNVDIGDSVEAGQELGRMETRDAEDALKDNQARYEQKRLVIEKLQESYQDAVRSGGEAALSTISRDIDSAKLDLEILARQIAKLQRDLAEFSRLTAPVSGIVTEVNAVKGAPVSSGKAAVRIAELARGLQLTATIDESKAPYVEVGDEAEILFSALNNARIPAKVTEIRDASLSSGQGEGAGTSGPSGSTGKTGKVVTFSLSDDRLKGGETGEFSLVKQTDMFRTLLPNEAVREDDNGPYILLLQEKKGPLGSEYVLQRASVQTGDSDDRLTSITNGVTPLDQVVVSSSKPVAEGDRVLAATDDDAEEGGG